MESIALIEFVADLFPECGLLPADPVERARVRRFYLQLDLTFFPSYRAFFMEGEAPDSFFDVLETLQGLLPETGFAIGPWSLADVAFAPMLVRLETMMANEFGKYQVGEGKKALEVLRGPRFARLSQYLEDVKQRPSVKATYNEVRYRVVRCVSLGHSGLTSTPCRQNAWP